jgi:magnesium transporter
MARKRIPLAGRRPHRKHSRHAPGTPPGTIRHDLNAPKPVIQVIGFSADDFEITPIQKASEVKPYLAKWPTVWVNVNGLGDPDLIAGMGAVFGLHSLALEDVVNTHQRAKLEEYDDVLYLVARMLRPYGERDTEQFSLFLGAGFVLSFQEQPGDCLEAIRGRIREKRGKVRNEGAGYLAYAILDAIVDDYFPYLEKISEGIEELELDVIGHPGPDTTSRIHDFQRDLLRIRRAVGPLRDAVSHLMRSNSPLIVEESRVYLRDCYDHTYQILDMVDTQREITAALLDVYLSAMSTRMNEIMKVLTIISTLFIPLTFIAGIYGMNFHHEASPWNMPELYTRYGYPVLLAFMTMVVTLELALFWRLGWFGKGRGGRRIAPKDPRHVPESVEF